MCLTAQEKIRNRMKIKNKTAGHAGIACFSFALKGNRAGSPHFKIVRFKWWEHVTKQGSGVLMADFDYKKRKILQNQEMKSTQQNF